MRRLTRALSRILIVGGLLTAVAAVRRRRATPALADAPIASTGALLPSPAASKLAVRMVITFLASLDFTVWIALPA